MRVSSHKLALSLADRLNKVMPKGFRLSAVNAKLELRIDGSWDSTLFAPEYFEDESRAVGERLESVAFSVLDSVQDSVIEHLRAPWPSIDGRKMAEPGVHYAEDALHLWYGGSQTSPVVNIPQIPLAEIVTDR